MNHTKASIWWGPPRKFSTLLKERKISWLELFYDLVYVIVISRVTHTLAGHPDWNGLVEYFYFFIMIYWGWLNGSLYHDLHASPGIRTRFMTLWQMMSVAALAVALSSPADTLVFRTTITLIVLQAFIIYLWWSVGIYDKHHRKLNVPYTICYVAALLSIITTLFIDPPFQQIFFWVTLFFNYLPPFVEAPLLRRENDDFSLSTSMMERMGLLTIIVFGEAILGVIGGISGMVSMNSMIWICFALGVLIVFSLWWIFFALVADRESKSGYLRGQIMLMIFIPTLGSLGMTGASFPGLIHGMMSTGEDHLFIERVLFGFGVAIFLWSITAISGFLKYPVEYASAKKLLQPLLIAAGGFILLLTWLMQFVELIWYLGSIFLILFSIIFVVTRKWFVVQMRLLEAENK